MKLNLKTASAAVAALALAGAAVALAVPASAAAPWSPDPASLGHIVFYDASGNVITGGSNLSHIAAYAAASTAGDAGATKAQLFFATPTYSATPDPSTWTSASVTGNTNYPANAAPAPISGTASHNGSGTAFTNPVVTLGSSDGNLSTYSASYPNSATQTGWVNVYQVRMVDSLGDGTQYWETDITVNPSAGTWAVTDPTVATTSTSISETPTSPQTSGASVTLNSTVTPAENGTVSFFDNGVAVGTPQAVTTSNGAASVSAGTPAVGTHPYTAVFTPTGGTEVQGSSSSTSNFVVAAPVTGTNTALSVNPGSAAQYSQVVFTANVTPAAAGSVQFFNGSSSLGTASTNDGTAGEYKLTIPSITLAVGSYTNITAVFTPTDPTTYGPSTSPAQPLTITAPACEGTPIAGGPTCTDTQNIQATVNPGSITVTTPYTPSNPFVLPAMTLNAGGTLLSTSATFPKSTDPDIVVTDSLAGDANWTLSVTDSDLTSGTGTINGENLGLTAGAIDNPLGGSITPAFPTSVGFTANPAANGTTVGGTGLGLKGGPHPFATTTGGGNGTADMHGTLTLNAPPQTPAGQYNGTITFSVA